MGSRRGVRRRRWVVEDERERAEQASVGVLEDAREEQAHREGGDDGVVHRHEHKPPPHFLVQRRVIRIRLRKKVHAEE